MARLPRQLLEQAEAILEERDQAGLLVAQERKRAQRRLQRKQRRKHWNVARNGGYEPGRNDEKSFVEYARNMRKVRDRQDALSKIWRNEHPATHGYTCAPVSESWEPRNVSPVFFGSHSHRKVDRTVARVNLKVFGLRASNWNDDLTESMRNSLFSIVQSSDPELILEFVTLESIEGVERENLRRVVEKTMKRAAKSDEFKVHLRNLLDAGCLNLEFHVKSSATKSLAARYGGFSMTQGHSAYLDLSFNIRWLERQRARSYCKALAIALTSNELQARFLQKAMVSLQDKQISITYNFAPDVHEVATCYDLPCDSPRQRKSRSRATCFEKAKVLSQAKLDLDLLGCKSFDGAKIVHPAFLGSKQYHIRPDVRNIHPIFWGQWKIEQFKPLRQVSCRKQHPAFCGEIIHAKNMLHGIFEDFRVKNKSPVWFGYERRASNENSLQAKFLKGIQSKEMIEEQDDEAFVLKLAKRSTKARRITEADDEKIRINQKIAQVKKRNQHPAIFGYKSSEFPSFGGNTSKFLHPTFFGYKTTWENRRMSMSQIHHVLHPSFLGNEIASQTFSSNEVVHPTFVGLVLQQGPRFDPTKQKKKFLDGEERRKQVLLSILANPMREGEKLCPICFAKSSIGCPKCWRPDPKQLEDNEARYGNAAKALVDNMQRFLASKRSMTPTEILWAQFKETSKLVLGLSEQKVELQNSIAINFFRERIADFVTVFVKPLPAGEVVQLRLESTRTIQELYAAYRANAPSQSANLQKLWLVLPTFEGLVSLDETCFPGDEYSNAFCPGTFKLEDFFINGRCCLFQIKDLRHPPVEQLVRAYVAANINLAPKLDLAKVESEEDERTSWATHPFPRQMKRFLVDKTSSVSLKGKIYELKMSKLKAKASSDKATLPKLSRQILEETSFDFIERPDQLPKGFKTTLDQLQKALFVEMKARLRRQEEAWREVVRDREERFQAEVSAKIKQSAETRRKTGNARCELKETKAIPKLNF